MRDYIHLKDFKKKKYLQNWSFQLDSCFLDYVMEDVKMDETLATGKLRHKRNIAFILKIDINVSFKTRTLRKLNCKRS